MNIIVRFLKITYWIMWNQMNLNYKFKLTKWINHSHFLELKKLFLEITEEILFQSTLKAYVK